MPATRFRDDLVRQRLDLFTKMLHGLERGDVRALHRMRIASRRLRELLPILQLDHNTTRKLSRRLRRVTSRLGGVRELDVLGLLLTQLHESGQYRHGALTRVANAVAHERDEARSRLSSKLPTADLRRLIGKLEKAADELASTRRKASRRDEAAWHWAMEARIARRAERFNDARREAGAVYLPERLHAVRIALKKLRYAVELSVEAAGERDNDELRTLKRAQDQLGHLHDFQVLIGRVRQLQGSLNHDATTDRALDAMVDGLENDCRRLHARYVRMR